MRCRVCKMSYIIQISTPFHIRINNEQTDITKQKSGKNEQKIEIKRFEKYVIYNIYYEHDYNMKIVPNKKERLICKVNMM